MWYEALPGLIIIGSCIAFTGWGLKVVDRLFQEGKPSRYNLDKFDERMMERDEKITGSKFRQKTELRFAGEQLIAADKIWIKARNESL